MSRPAQSGFSLVEGLLSIGLFALIITALGGGGLYGLFAVKSAGDHQRASLLATEGLEGVYNLGQADFDSLSAGEHGLLISNAAWELSGSETLIDNFTRSIEISNISETQKNITSTVTWSHNLLRTGIVQASMQLTNWSAQAATTPEAGSRTLYYDETNKDLKLAWCDNQCDQAENWSFTTIDAAGDVGTDISLATLDSGFAASYYHKDEKNLIYAVCSSACHSNVNWITVTAQSSGDVGQHTSLAFESGKPRISFYDEGAKDLKFAYCDENCTQSAQWNSLTIDSSDDVGQHTSLAIDDSGAMHITYYDESNKDLRYAYCASGCTSAPNWNTTTIDSNKEVGEYSSIQLENGSPRVAYYREKNANLRYATCESSCTNANNWTKSNIDTNGKTGQFSSLFLEDGTKPRVSYYRESSKNLKFAACDADCNDSDNWNTVTVHSSGDVGQYSSLTIEDETNHLFYYREDSKDLMYTYCSQNCTDADNWSNVTLDSSDDVGSYARTNN